MDKQQKGFTLIELVIVIVIIGILAALALPRYIDMQRDARLAKIQALYGSIRSASALAHARCLLDLNAGLVAVGTCGNAAPTVTMDSVVVSMFNQWPQALATGPLAPTGILGAAGLNPAAGGGDAITVTGGGAGAGAVLNIDPTGYGGAAGTCRIVYTAAAAAAGSAPSITLTASQANC